MTDAWVFLIIFLVGVALAGAAFVFNSSTPLQVGPIPFFVGVAMAVVGLIALIAKIVP